MKKQTITEMKTPSGVVIRPAKPGEEKRLREIEEDCFDPTLYGHCLSERSFKSFIHDGRNMLGVAVSPEGEIIGYALLLVRRGTDVARFYSLAVSNKAQGTGIGRDLFQWAEQAALARGLGRMGLEIREDNETLLKRYQKIGYRVLRSAPNYYEDGAAALKLERRLDAAQESAPAERRPRRAKAS